MDQMGENTNSQIENNRQAIKTLLEDQTSKVTEDLDKKLANLTIKDSGANDIKDTLVQLS